MNRTYKGFEIVKQTVGERGWNVSKNGKCFKGMTGFASLKAAKEWINEQIEMDELRGTDAWNAA